MHNAKFGQGRRIEGVIVGLLGCLRWCGTPFRSNYQTLIAGLLPPISSPIFPLYCSFFGTEQNKHLTLSKLSIRALSCVICGLGLPRSKITRFFEGAKITFGTFLTQK